MSDEEGAGSKPLKHSNPEKPGFQPEVLDRTTIAVPLLRLITAEGGAGKLYDVIIDANLEFVGGRDRALETIAELVQSIRTDALENFRNILSEQYLFAELEGSEIQALVAADREAARARVGDARSRRAIYRIWLDEEVRA